MKKFRFVIVGSGWRSLFYVRIAKEMPEVFEVAALLCRSEEKAQKIAKENALYTTTSIEECKRLNPDFIVVAVNKASIFEVTKEWLQYGFKVLCETPAALTVEQLSELWKLHQEGKQVLVAEQYRYMPLYQSYHKIFSSGLLGTVNFLHISLAHEYHGANLIRFFLVGRIADSFSVFSGNLREKLTIPAYNEFVWSPGGSEFFCFCLSAAEIVLKPSGRRYRYVSVCVQRPVSALHGQSPGNPG